MPILYPGDDPYRALLTARSLADDLQRIADGGPSPADLRRAPLLDYWSLARRSEPALIGLVHGHPELGSGGTTLTSLAVVLDADAGWARTWSRYYRLGRPANLKSGRSQ